MDENVLLPYPYEFKAIEESEQEELNKLYDVFIQRCFRVGPHGYLVYEPFKKDAANIYNMPIRSSDIFVASYQRSGTTLTQELVWLIANDLDYNRAAEVMLTERYSFLDHFMHYDENLIHKYVTAIKKQGSNTDEEKLKHLIGMWSKPVSRTLATMHSPRFIKTHLPMSLLNPNLLDTAKVVYVARDPRDVVVSCYHQSKLFKLMHFPDRNGIKCFWNIFRRNLFTLLPYFDHVKEAWNKRTHPNMLFLFYEEINKDLPAAIRRIAAFLGKELNPEHIDPLLNHLSIDNFKNNPSINCEHIREHGLLASEETFIRKGKTGSWRDYFDDEMTHQAEQWIKDNLLDTDLRFPRME